MRTGLSVRAFAGLCAATFAITVALLALEAHKRPHATQAVSEVAVALDQRIREVIEAPTDLQPGVLTSAQVDLLESFRAGGYVPDPGGDLHALGGALVTAYQDTGTVREVSGRAVVYLYVQPDRVRICARGYLFSPPQVPYRSYVADSCLDLDDLAAEPVARGRGDPAQSRPAGLVFPLHPLP